VIMVAGCQSHKTFMLRHHPVRKYKLERLSMPNLIFMCKAITYLTQRTSCFLTLMVGSYSTLQL
jgi:hypothetical protein